MEEIASDSRYTDKIAFIVINTNDGVLGKKMTEEAGWKRCNHVHLSVEDKGPVIEALSIKRVPHHVMIDAQGSVLQNGKAFSWDKVEELAGIAPKIETKIEAAAADVSSAFSFSLDEDF
jgi:hypothetical protein